MKKISYKFLYLGTRRNALQLRHALDGVKVYFDNHTRLNANLTDYRATKLDVQQRNSYNRTNHNRYQSPSQAAQHSSHPYHYQPSQDPLGRDYHPQQPLPQKTVRFDGQDSDDWSRWESERQGSQDSATKDSGIDTSSTFTSSEDSNRGDGPKNPLSWQVVSSSDGGRPIGPAVQRRPFDGEDVLGLKVRGGQVLPSDPRAALIELESAHIRPENYDRRDKPSVLVTSPGSPDLHSVRNYSNSRYSNRLAPAGTVTQENSVGGRVQIKLGFEPSSLQLIVTILCANGLVPRGNGAARNPYVKICLLPDRSEKSKRRTKTLALTNDPRWGQTFVYEGLRRADLNNRLFEVTVWDYVRYGANDFLGEVIIDLSTHPLDDEAEWYILQPHQDTLRDTVRIHMYGRLSARSKTVRFS
uniref:C2 domain-containing protein n=1 Tax=Anopheles melas TaxID=34690 RepID=A0A182TPE1_9DIPT